MSQSSGEVRIASLIAAINGAAAVSAVLASRGWAALALTQLAYGVAARVPVW
jgi:hypothetical protein